MGDFRGALGRDAAFEHDPDQQDLLHVLQGPSAHGVALVAVPKASAEHALAKLQGDPRLRFVTTVPQ